MFLFLSAIFAFFAKKKQKKMVLGLKNRRNVICAWENVPLVISEAFEIKNSSYETKNAKNREKSLNSDIWSFSRYRSEILEKLKKVGFRAEKS